MAALGGVLTSQFLKNVIVFWNLNTVRKRCQKEHNTIKKWKESLKTDFLWKDKFILSTVSNLPSVKQCNGQPLLFSSHISPCHL